MTVPDPEFPFAADGPGPYPSPPRAAPSALPDGAPSAWLARSEAAPRRALALALALPLAVGALGGLATASSVRTWYPMLRKPSFNPPGWIFGPVWTALYLLMGLAMHLVWTASGRVPTGGVPEGEPAGRVPADRVRATRLWLAQLLLNLLWSLIFFGRRAIGPAFGEILVLWVAIVATLRAFAQQRRVAAILLVPYLGWTTFAALLNGSIWYLNRDR